MYNILVVDDEPMSAEYIVAIIQKKCKEFRIIGIKENGQQALEEIAKSDVDIVISDVKMPVMDGIQLVKEIKCKCPHIKTLLISGYQEFTYAREAISAGVCDYLLKPLKAVELVRNLDEMKLQLDEYYYLQRNKILRQCCNQYINVEQSEMDKYFGKGDFYALVIRQNGMPRKF